MSGYRHDFGQQKYEGDLYSDAQLQFNNHKAPGTRKKEDIAKTNLKPEQRGMGKTGVTHRYLSDAEKMAMCHLRGKGLTNVEIAEKLKRSESVVSSVFRQVEKAAQAAGLNFDWREDLNNRAIYALRAGLDCEEDQYKRAKLGIETLKGTGEFEIEGKVDLARLVSGIPAGHEGRYIEIKAESPELPEGHSPDE